MALENSMLVMNGKQVGGNTQDLTGYQTKVDNNLETESKEIVKAINELRSEKADTDIVAADFNTGTSYTAGNYCIHEGKFYKFKANHTGAWSAADVDEIKIAGELSALKSGLNDVNSNINGLTEINVIPLTSDFYAEVEKKARYVKLNVGNNGLYVITGDFKNENALTADTAYTIAVMPDNALVDSFGEEFNNAGKITIARNSKNLVFTPSANAAAYTTFRISIMFIV